MPSLTASERLFLLVICLVTVVGTVTARMVPRRPEAFPGLAAARVPAGEPGDSFRRRTSREGRLTRRCFSPESSSPLLEEQIRLVEETLARGEGENRARTLSPGGGGGPLHLNRASAEELQALPGIGPVLAERIVRDRDLHGPFARLDDLARVKGIGPRTVDRLRGAAVAGSLSTMAGCNDSGRSAR